MACSAGKRVCSGGSSGSDDEASTSLEIDRVGCGVSNSSQPNEGNPMLNPVVLKTFFKVCKLEDLRRFRLVCRLWRDVSLESWRNEMTLIIGFDKYFELRRNSNKRQRLHWKKASLLYRTPSIARKPFRKYRLWNWEFPEEYPDVDDLFMVERRRILREFWTNCGAWMDELEVKEPSIESGEMFKECLVKLAPNVTSLKLMCMSEFDFGRVEEMEGASTQLNLKSLSIRLNSDDYETMGQVYSSQVPIPWFDLFASFPNLKELNWDICLDVLCDGFITAWNSIIQEGDPGRTLRMKSCSLNDRFHNCDSDKFRELFECPNLTFVDIGISTHIPNVEQVLIRALELHRNTLETLYISACSRDLKLGDTLQGPFVSTMNLDLRVTTDFHFLKHFPNLAKLTMTYVSKRILDGTCPEEMENVLLHKLTHLSLNHDSARGCSEYWKPIVEILAKCMPNVIVLKIPLTNATFRVVCEHWRDLKELHDLHAGIADSDLDDEGITGIVPGVETRFSNITLLKYLRKFRTMGEISDNSIWDGFLHLEHLTDLDSYRLDAKITVESKAALFSKFGREVMHATDRNNVWKFDEYDEFRLEAQKLSKDYGILLRFPFDLFGSHD